MPATASVVTRLDSLTGLRFFAALLVFGRHVSATGEMERGADTINFLEAGMSGVSFFYILSGFVLAWTARSQDTTWLFYRRRFARVYPLYIAAWFLAVALSLVLGDGFTWEDFFALTLLQAWIPSEPVYFAASAVFWSLSVEAFFYLAFPFIFPKLARLTQTGRLVTAAVCVALIFGVAALVHGLDLGREGIWFIYIFPPVRLLEFVLGILLALQLKDGTRWRFPLWGALAVGVVAYLSAPMLPDEYTRVALMVVPFVLIVWAAARADLLGLWSPFRARWVVTLGVWSYAFYLTHMLVVKVLSGALDRAGMPPESLGGITLVAFLLGALLVAIAVSGIMHKLVEAPAERWLRPKRSAPRLDGDEALTSSSSART